MKARLQAWLEALGDQFWLRPAFVVIGCLGLALGAVRLDEAGLGGGLDGLGYSGGGEGARSLLSAVASSAIGVASTIFSITIAALSLASGQMGPRLLRNFVRDARNQLALGIFLGTFAYALIVLRAVRTEEQAAFVPHLAATGAMLLALLCIGTLVWFVHHVATSINVERVVEAVHEDLCAAIQRRSREEADPAFPPVTVEGPLLSVSGSLFLQAIDEDALADWASEAGVTVALRVRPGDFVPLGAPVARLDREIEGARAGLERALTFGRRSAALQDIEYPVRQLTEIAVRALSPGINDPFTAGSVLDRFGDALCRLVPRHLPSGVVMRGGRVVLLHPVTTYAGLCDTMFHTIRQNAAGSVYVLARIVEVLGRVAEIEPSAERLAELRRHADLALDAAKRDIAEPAALADIEERHRRLPALVGASSTMPSSR